MERVTIVIIYCHYLCTELYIQTSEPAHTQHYKITSLTCYQSYFTINSCNSRQILHFILTVFEALHVHILVFFHNHLGGK